MSSTLKLLESSNQQATTIIIDNDGLKIRTPKTNSTNKGTRSCGCCYNKKGTRNCASCFNKGGIYEQIDSVVAHEINVTYYRVVKCIVNAEGIVHLSVVSSQHDDHLVEFKGSPTNIPIEDAKTMIDDIRNKAAIGDPKRFLVLVNPVGGQGKAIRYYNEKVFPILRASGCKIDFQMLEYKLHAYDIGKEMQLDYDGVLCVSGDGAIHEVLNGFMKHETPIKALQMPLCPIPAGSGNSLSLCLLGLEDGCNISLATLNAIKGNPMPLDLFSIVQGNKRTLSYLTQATGLMADLDIGTEGMRWLGDTRFVIGYVRSLITNSPCPCEIYVKIDEDNKDEMIKQLRERKLDSPVPSLPQYGEELPPVQYPNGAEPDWEKVSGDISYLYAGQVPWVSRDLKQFPVSIPNDGYIDIAAQLNVSRFQKIKAMDGAENGKMFYDQSLKYYKAKAYHYNPLRTDGYISIDGENSPVLPFTVEVLPCLARVISPYYTWNNNF
ncbi:hypothetical protein E3Q00_04251 [Wallemia mellicola]|nr:hypothetical protein E3Q00_04251 [Wallemia mellicola]